MSAPIVYSHDDPGAPVFLKGAAGMREILLGCLVNGYGDKPAAGWSVVYDDWVNSGNLSITNAAQSGVLGLWHPLTVYASYGPVLYVAEAMQSATQPINGRSRGVEVSSTAALSFNSSSYQHSAYANSSDGMEWVIVATDNTAIVLMSRGSDGYLHGNPQPFFAAARDRPDMLVIGAVNHYAGLGPASAPVLGNFYVLGGSSSYNGYSNRWGSTVRCSMLRNNNGSLIDAERYALIAPMLGLNNPAELVYELELRPWRLYTRPGGGSVGVDNADQTGLIPGLYGFADMASYDDADDFARFNPGVDAFRAPATVINKNCLYGVVGSATPVFISLAAEDW